MKIIITLLLITNVIFTACKKDNGSNKNWKVKYEVVCSNPNTKGVFIFRDETASVITAGSTTVPVTIPWSYSANYSKDPGLSTARFLQLVVIYADPYSGSDVITAKIYVDGNVVTQSSTPGAIGIMITYTLQ